MTQRINDERILASEAQNEYTKRFVYPRLFPPKRDTGISTESPQYLKSQSTGSENATISSQNTFQSARKNKIVK
jgi:hypothetical protein